jgi:uncharacterized protein (TIGR04255 family)
MVQGRPKFDSPPVVETALSVQFARLPGYSTAHAGWFWKEYLEKLGDGPSQQWSKAAETVRLEDQFERFGVDEVWLPPFKFVSGIQPQRVQIIRSDGERLIQVQDSRFVLNWKKQASAYPSYETILAEFRTMLHAFETFAHEAGFGKLEYNQWEITYVDQIKKGDMWESARDWVKIFPGFSMATVNPQLVTTGDETLSADWRFSLAGQRGRVYVSVRQMRPQPQSSDEFLNVTFTARGPVNESQTWQKGLDLGHEAITDIFLAMTSPEAQQHWRRQA